jgi:DNA-directed RNA polymerase subunit RPC12/RpoP
MKFHCRFCDQRLEADSEMIGSQIECPACSKEIIVKLASADVSEQSAREASNQHGSKSRTILVMMAIGGLVAVLFAISNGDKGTIPADDETPAHASDSEPATPVDSNPEAASPAEPQGTEPSFTKKTLDKAKSLPERTFSVGGDRSNTSSILNLHGDTKKTDKAKSLPERTFSVGGDRSNTSSILNLNSVTPAKSKNPVSGAVYVSNDTIKKISISIRSYIGKDGKKHKLDSSIWHFEPGEFARLRSHPLNEIIIASRVDYTVHTENGDQFWYSNNYYADKHKITVRKHQTIVPHHLAYSDVAGLKARAAKNDLDAMGELSSLYYYGTGGCRKDRMLGRKYAEAAAKANHPVGITTYGLCFDHGAGGIERDFFAAFRLYKRAAELGHVQAQANLGVMCYLGDGTRKDFYEGHKWLLKAAKKGSADAMNGLGVICFEGPLALRSRAEGIAWYQKAAALGCQEAAKNLRDMKYNDLRRFEFAFSAISAAFDGAGYGGGNQDPHSNNSMEYDQDDWAKIARDNETWDKTRKR